MIRRVVLAVAAVIAVVGPTSSAVAATVTVSPTGAITTIQGGIDAAVAGDTVLVKAGTYRENVTISAKAGLVLKAKGKVILDARPNGATGSGSAITIASSDTVVVEGFTIQHAASDGMGDLGRGVISTGSIGVTVRKCTFIDCADFAVQITGVSARVDNCKVLGGGGGVNVIGNGFSVTKTTVREVDDDGIRVNGLLGLVQSCTIAGTSAGQGIHLTGQGCVVEKCLVTRTTSEGLLVSNDGNLVQKNVFRDIEDQGINALSADQTQVLSNTITGTLNEAILIDGADAIVQKNKLSEFGTAGIAVEGSTFTITQNTVSSGGVNTTGISVSTATGGGTIEKNSISDVRDGGIVVEATAGMTQVTKNVVQRCGTTNSSGIRVAGNAVVVDGNKVKDGVGDGIAISSDSVLVQNNVVTNNGLDGIDVDSIGADGTQLVANSVTGNGAEGIENNGVNTVCTNNVAKNNRTDVGNDGMFLTFTGNVFLTGGSGFVPEID
ncbi:MAG: right-handed parallel beta-helix repeat-containing protein [Planctomycetes bacterium]|nr:right-handed parallel beta-helix repeat-containing protein [Planctomycetota bacterium]